VAVIFCRALMTVSQRYRQDAQHHKQLP